MPVATLTYNGNLIVNAALAHTEVSARLPVNFVADTNTLLGKVTTDVTGQSSSHGDLGTLTAAQHVALDTLQSWMTKARKTARLAFPGQTVKLHEEFQVGIHQPHDLASILNRADIVLAGLQKPANLPALTLKGWIAADTTAFASARQTLGTGAPAQQTAKGGAKDATGTTHTDAGDLYANLLAIQNAADLQWPVEDPPTPASAMNSGSTRSRPQAAAATTRPPPPPNPRRHRRQVRTKTKPRNELKN